MTRRDALKTIALGSGALLAGSLPAATPSHRLERGGLRMARGEA